MVVETRSGTMTTMTCLGWVMAALNLAFGNVIMAGLIVAGMVVCGGDDE
jgi:hypothetical protein